MGPQTDEEIQREFTQLFARTCELTGDVFALAAEADILKEVNRRLVLRGLTPLKSLPDQMNLELLLDTLPPGAKQRLEQYLGVKKDFEGIGGACLCDVEQWLSKGKSGVGPYFPCQLTHGTVVSLALLRSFLGAEHVAAQGFHIFPQTSDKYSSVMADVIKPLSEKDIKELSGNAMSLPAWAAWVAYVCSNTARIVDMKPMAETSMAARGSSNADLEFSDCAGDAAQADSEVDDARSESEAKVLDAD